jgi:hypothetical protein
MSEKVGKTTIQSSIELRNELMMLKFSKGMESIEDVIKYLIENYKKGEK